MKTIPILLGFDSTKPIGSMTIDEKMLPAGAEYVFSLGYMLEGKGKIELICTSLMTDADYRRYLDSDQYKSQQEVNRLMA